MNLREKFPKLEPGLLYEIEREGMIKEFAVVTLNRNYIELHPNAVL